MRPRTLSLLLAAAAGAYFVDLFLRWFGPAGHGLSGWQVPLSYVGGVLALGAVLVEAVRLSGVWSTRASALVAFFLAAAAAIMGLAALVNLRWGGISSGGFGMWLYGAWIGLALALLLLGAAILRLLELSRP